MGMSFYRAPVLRDWAASALHRGSQRAGLLAHSLSTSPIQVATPNQPARGATGPTNCPDVVSPERFSELLDASLREATETGETVNLVAVRVDYFDALTASHGHAAGTEVMAVAVERLRQAVRGEDMITTVGNDGLAVLWCTPEQVDAVEIAGRIANRFSPPIETTTAGQLPVSVSVGTTSCSGSVAAGMDASALQVQAQTAVAAAKVQGRGQFVAFDLAMQQREIQSYETERQLRAAVHAQAVGVHYQPIVSLHTGDVVGVEALARWRDESGFVSPETFIPIAEESGLIGELGRLVLAASIEQGGIWNAPAATDRMLTVNLSNRQLLDPELIPVIAELLTLHELDPGRLCLEITESVVMNNVAASMTILGHMKDLGLMLAIDDFGTGYSSLSYLRRLPVDILKIDRSFVQSIYNRDDRMITKAIIDLAHTLGMTTVAEGVETRLQVEVLHALNCDMAQGFLLHPPSSADKIDFTSVDFDSHEDDASSLLTGSLDSLSAPAVPRALFAQR